MKKEYEYIIVGSGIAGSTVAKRLLEHNRSTSIFMLEAGPKVEAKSRRYWWDYVAHAHGPEHKPYDFTYDQPGESKSIGKTPFLIEGSRVTAYGGSTVHWGGWCLRFKSEDFKLYANTGEGGDWPIAYEDLLDYYDQAEDHLSVCGDITESWNQQMRPNSPYPRPPFRWTAADGEMIKGFEKNDIEPGKMPIARYRKCLTTGTCKYCPFGARFSGQYVLDDLLADTRNLHFKLQSNAPATQILLDSKSRITGVAYLDLVSGGQKEVYGSKVIICSGAYESPKLLMLSGKPYWGAGIGNDHDLLGRYVVTHSILMVRGELGHNKERWFQEYDFPTLMSRTYDTEEHQKNNKIFLFKNRKLPNLDLAALMIQGKSREEIDAIFTGSRQTELQAFMEEKGQKDNRLTLAQGKNRFGLPNMHIAFNRTEQAKKNGKQWLEIMANVITSMNYKILFRKIQDPGGHHTTGTCRMGETPELGVTDSDLRVHGTENLYLCSNAVFPSGAAVNPTLTLTALAYRLGDHLGH